MRHPGPKCPPHRKDGLARSRATAGQRGMSMLCPPASTYATHGFPRAGLKATATGRNHKAAEHSHTPASIRDDKHHGRHSSQSACCHGLSLDDPARPLDDLGAHAPFHIACGTWAHPIPFLPFPTHVLSTHATPRATRPVSLSPSGANACPQPTPSHTHRRTSHPSAWHRSRYRT